MDRKLMFPPDEEFNDVVKRYEQYLSGIASGYFDVEELSDIVEYYLRRGRTKDCAKVLDFGTQLHPNSSELRVKRAKVFLATGDYQRAILMLDTLSEKNDYEATLLRIEALLRLGRRKEALILCNRVSAQESDELDNVSLDIANVFSAQNDFATALAWLKKGDEFNSENIDLLFDLAFCYEQELNYTKSVETYNRIIDIDPYMSEGWFNLGQVHFVEQNYAKALEAYDFALTINDVDALTCLQKAHTHFQLDQFDEAIETYLEYGDLTNDRWQTNLFLAECYEKMERYSEAITYYSLSLEMYPQNYDALTGIGICLLEQEKYNESIKYFQDAIAVQEDVSDAWVYLAEALLAMNDLDGALLAYDSSLALYPEQPDTLMAVASIYLEKGDFETALRYYMNAQQKDNSLEYIQLFISICYFKMEDEDAGLFHLRRAITQDNEARELFVELCPEYKDSWEF